MGTPAFLPNDCSRFIVNFEWTHTHDRSGISFPWFKVQ
ncbi:hypothetical protein LEP1GSC165_2800 [Leptospira santarosai str. CBC523]|nr:hypothetical protein LEP1GSC165_2800 [Leptospira santarosai str. CBC523]